MQEQFILQNVNSPLRYYCKRILFRPAVVPTNLTTAEFSRNSCQCMAD